MNVKTTLPILCAAMLMASCQKDASNRQSPGQPASDQASAAGKAPPSLPRVAPAQRQDEIRKGGRTGLWSTPEALCANARKTSVVLTWNVENEHDAARTVLSVVDAKTGKEKPFGRGGAVGERQTGPWAKPGMTFSLKDASTGDELASVMVGSDCPPKQD